MKKARKKRIVRRKRRISEREIMRTKRKLKKSARKLRLGAKRTGAYVYGTLRRIVGNPGGRYRVGGGYKTFTLDEAKREAERIFRTTGNIVSIEEHRPTPQVAPAWKYGIYTGRGVVRKNPGGLKILGYRSGMQYLTDGKDVYRRDKMDMKHGGMKWYSTYASFPASIRAYGPLTSPRGLRGNPGKLFPASYPPEKKLILFLARREGWKKYKVSRTGTYPFELRIDGVGKNDIQFSGLLKLIAIHSLVNWTSPQVAMMSSYPSMVREGDWSGIRDSSDDAIDNIFYNFVLKPLGVAKPIQRIG